ncbi:MAG: RNA polymerase sigma factor, partial [Verrucomicrobiia bacterium]
MDDANQALAALLSRARARDAAAAEALVAAFYGAVMAVVERRRPKSVDAGDIAQEVFLKMFQRLDDFRGGPSELEAWLRRTAFRTCLDHHRRQRSRPEVRWADLSEDERAALDAIGRGDTDYSPAERAGGRELVDLLLSSLSAKERLLIEMLNLENRGMEEVQQLTGWSEINIRVRVYRARRRLR